MLNIETITKILENLDKSELCIKYVLFSTKTFKFIIFIIFYFYFIILFQLFGESNNENELENKDIGDQTQRIICKQMVEVCLYILWAHTDYYFMQSPVQHAHRPKGLNSKYILLQNKFI